MRRQYNALKSNGVKSHLCGLTTSESAASAPASTHRLGHDGHHAGVPHPRAATRPHPNRPPRLPRLDRCSWTTSCRPWQRRRSAAVPPRDPLRLRRAGLLHALRTGRQPGCDGLPPDPGRASALPCRSTSACARSSRRAGAGCGHRPARARGPLGRRLTRCTRVLRAAWRWTPCRI